jgi:ABC-type multidrug transport system fused ATPase/permease subunit
MTYADALSTLVAAVAVVQQDASLFNEDLEYNIAYGRLDATREQVYICIIHP